MQLNNVDFKTYFKNYPDANGYFGKYGGAYIPEELKKAQEKEAAKQDWASQKEFAAKKRKWETGLKKAEEEIARLEEKITELSTAMEEVGSDAGRLMELHKEQEVAEASLQEQYAIWEESSLALEELEEG